MASRTRYYLRLPEPAKARGSDPELAFSSESPDGLAAELQQALRGNELFERWRVRQDDPDAIDPLLGATDAEASVRGEQHTLAIDLVATTTLPGGVFKHRLRLLAGNGWELRDVTAG
ncbi:MAG: hypothetical protein KAY12_04575 [Arenimonas sp.]|nr:hypothetical protein [Arenimonas sp.]MBP8097761.1 hypothetical protein [Arenimonas sp.]